MRERQKHILLADKSEYGWATVHEDKKHELADNSYDEKRIFKSEILAKAQRKHNKSKLSADRFCKPRGPPDAAFKVLQSRPFPAQPNMFKLTIRPRNCYSCGKVGHWRNECSGSSQQWLNQGVTDYGSFIHQFMSITMILWLIFIPHVKIKGKLILKLVIRPPFL